MAIQKYTNSRGTFYHASTYIVVDGVEKRPHKRGFKTKLEAQKWIDSVRVNGFDKPTHKLTYEDVYNEWIESYKLTVRPSTFNKTDGMFKHHILPALGHKKITDIKRVHCQSFINKLSEIVARPDKVLIYLKKVFVYAIQEEYINKNPCDNLLVPRKKKSTEKGKTHLTAQELNTLLELCKSDNRPHIYPLFRLLSYTGMRRQEVLPLMWNDIDFEKGTLSINKAITRDYDNTYYIGETKNESSNRIISLDDETLNIMREWKIKNHYKTGLVFPNSNGTLMSNSYINKTLQALCKRAEIEPISSHRLRHTHCTILIEAGVNIKDVQERLGHSDIETTLKIYAHANNNKKAAIDKFSKFVAIS